MVLKRDLIYEDLLEIYPEGSLKLENLFIPDDYSLLPYPELIKQRLLRSKYKSIDRLAYPTDVLQLLLLHRNFITTEQIRTLKLFSNESSAIMVRMSKMQKANKKGGPILKSQYIDKNKDSTKAYYLTPYGRQKMKDELPDSYLVSNRIDLNKQPSLGNLAHDIEILNLFYSLIVDENFIDFQWLDEVPLMKYDTLDEMLSNFSNVQATDINGTVRPDALIIPWTNSYTGAIYVEQDMRNERLNFIQEKLARYDALLDNHSIEDLVNETILFCTKTDVKDEIMTEKNDFGNINKLISMRSDLKRFMESSQSNTVKDAYKNVCTVIKNARDNPEIKSNTLQWYLKLQKFIKAAFEYDSTITKLDDMSEYIQYCKSSIEKQEVLDHMKSGEKQLIRRIATYRSAALQVENLKTKMQQGLSILACDSRNLLYLPHLFVREYKTYEKLFSIFKRKYMKANPKYHYSSFFAIEKGSQKYVFKNAIHMSSVSSVPLFIENISHDIAAAYRVRYYFENIINELDTAFFLLLVKNNEDAIEFSQSLNLASRFRNSIDVRNPKNDVHILFASYENDESKEKLFVVDKEGELVYFEENKY